MNLFRACSLFLWCLFLLASVPPSFAATRSVAVILTSDKGPYQETYKGVRDFFAERNLSLTITEYNLERENPDDVIRKVSQKRPDLLLTIGTRATEFAKDHVKNLPVVFSMVLDPKPFSDPHFTGVSLEIPLSAKLSGTRKILPAAKRIGVIYSPESEGEYKELVHSAEGAGFQIIGKRILSAREFPDALKDLSWRIDAFLMVPDATLYFPQSVKHLLLSSVQDKFPVIGLSASYTRAGAMISFESDYREVGRQTGEVVSRVLSGEAPGAIPPSGPRKIRYSLNLITADRLGLSIPSSVIKEAAEVIRP